MKFQFRAMVIPLMPFLVAVLAATISHAAFAAEVYKWTDKDGVIHFSDVKPASAQSQTINMQDTPGQAGYSPPAPATAAPEEGDAAEQTMTAAQQRREEMAERRKEHREEQAEIEKMCKRHSQRLEQMEPARRVYYTDDNGQEVRMDDVQRVSLIEESRNYLAENCN